MPLLFTKKTAQAARAPRRQDFCILSKGQRQAAQKHKFYA
jgi:hypothetical protein